MRSHNINVDRILNAATRLTRQDECTKIALLSSRKRGPLYTIKPSSGWGGIDPGELWAFRDLLLSLAWRDIKVRYRQTYLGAIWVLLQPLIGAAVFLVVFHQVARLSSPAGIPYFIVSYCSLMGWNLFSTVLTKSSNSLVSNSHLISKIYFPRIYLPLSAVLSSCIDFFLSLALLFLIMSFCGVPLTPQLIALPIWFFLTVLLATGIGLQAGALMVSYRDVQHILPVALQLLFYASPVGFTLADALTRVPARWSLFFCLNPLSALLEGFRLSVLGVGQLPTSLILYSFIFCFATFITGLISFRHLERKFADVI
jgi:lipopolysaccharide transport system permease protein